MTSPQSVIDLDGIKGRHAAFLKVRSDDAGAQALAEQVIGVDHPALVARVEQLEKALREIAKGEGEFSRDPLQHATNTIDSMKEIASTALSPRTNP